MLRGSGFLERFKRLRLNVSFSISFLNFNLFTPYINLNRLSRNSVIAYDDSVFYKLTAIVLSKTNNLYAPMLISVIKNDTFMKTY